MARQGHLVCLEAGGTRVANEIAAAARELSIKGPAGLTHKRAGLANTTTAGVVATALTDTTLTVREAEVAPITSAANPKFAALARSTLPVKGALWIDPAIADSRSAAGSCPATARATLPCLSLAGASLIGGDVGAASA